MFWWSARCVVYSFGTILIENIHLIKRGTEMVNKKNISLSNNFHLLQTQFIVSSDRTFFIFIMKLIVLIAIVALAASGKKSWKFFLNILITILWLQLQQLARKRCAREQTSLSTLFRANVFATSSETAELIQTMESIQRPVTVNAFQGLALASRGSTQPAVSVNALSSSVLLTTMSTATAGVFATPQETVESTRHTQSIQKLVNVNAIRLNFDRIEK
jgi:hypothetical protein